MESSFRSFFEVFRAARGKEREREREKDALSAVPCGRRKEGRKEGRIAEMAFSRPSTNLARLAPFSFSSPALAKSDLFLQPRAR